MQSSGNRLYFNETLEIKLHAIKQLKAMNNSYPESTIDFDEKFVYILSFAVFDKNEMDNCLNSDNLKNLNQDRLKFVKGIVDYYF